MGKCSNCKKEILYNKFKWYRGKVLCKECYATRLDRKKAAKKEAEERLKKEDTEKVAAGFGIADNIDKDDPENEPVKDLENV